MIRKSLALLTLLACLPLAATAQDDPTPQEPRPIAEEPAESKPGAEPAATPVDPISLRLTEAVSNGIENNLQLEVERYDPLIALEDQRGSWGSFDPKSQLEWDYLSQTDPVSANSLFGNERNRHKENKANLGIETLLPYLGATLGVDLNVNETRDIGNPFVSQRPVYDSGFTIRGSLPLLKGLIWNEPWTRVRTSAAAYDGSRENFRADLMNVVQFIETAYWDLVAQSQAVRVARKSLETARSLLDQTQTQYEVGVKSKVEVVEAEAGAAAREFDLIRAINRHQKAQDDLIDAVFGTRLTAGSRLNIEPADDPENYVHYDIDTEDAANEALAKRPELAEAQTAIEQQELQLKFAKNQRLPQLDLRASYGTSGRRGEGVTSFNFQTGMNSPNPTTGNNVGDTFNDYWTNRGGEDLQVGAVFSIPLGNVSARHNVSKSALALRKAKAQLTRLRQDIILQVREEARNLASAQEGIEAAERRRIAAAEQLRAEQVRLEYGESTPFKVLEKEQDLVEAENEKIGALFTYRKSVIDLHRARGTILEARNIVVDQAAALR
ncbi:MAG: TolC family protein [Myxococcota bacterium]